VLPDLLNFLAQSPLTSIHCVDAADLQGNQMLVGIREQPIGVLLALGTSADHPTSDHVYQGQRNRFSGVLGNPVEVELVAADGGVCWPIQSPLFPAAVKPNFERHAGTVTKSGKPNRRFMCAISTGCSG
jgi:hypothetical protein